LTASATDPRRVVIAGGSGSLGLAIANELASDGFEVVLLTRKVRSRIEHTQVRWDGRTVKDRWAHLLAGSVVINLAGELVDRRPTPSNKELLTQSRVRPTRALVAASREGEPVAAWLQMSTLAIYGDAGAEILTDYPEAPPANWDQILQLPQMIDVSTEWEKSLNGANTERTVYLRTGVVLEQGTPALNRLVTMTKLLLGGTVGSGKQYVSWIHVADFVGIVKFLLTDNAGRDLNGVLHVTSPEPVTNRELMAGLRKALRRPWTPPTPAWLVKLGAAVIFRTDPNLALTGRRGVPQRLINAGFAFSYPEINSALRSLLRR
jgi:uncharacterized protein (TIGR01777 family)